MGRKPSTRAHEQVEMFPKPQPARYGNGRRRQRLFLPKLLDAPAAHVLSDLGAAQAREQGHTIVTRWAELEKSGKLYDKTETAVEGEFLTEVFGQALGYALFSENLDHWDLQPKWNVNGGTADAAIAAFAAGAKPVPRVLIELKGPRVDLDRDRSQGRTPVRQLWEYLNDVPECPWGILCNYVSFRLYHRNKGTSAYELFTLQDLCDPKLFGHFYAIFERGGFLPYSGRRPRADQVLELSDVECQEVGDKLYNEYHDGRSALIHHFRRKPYQKSLDEAIHIGQKLLDRVIFVAFCQWRDLLPWQSIEKAFKTVSPFEKVVNPRWRNFRNLFRSVDEGNDRENIWAYDGGLFAEDPAVDNLELDDDWTRIFAAIGTYDFSDAINVDVLGHLFEKSVTDLELLRTDPDTHLQPTGKKPVGRRKREGIYYTPPHITGYIVAQTIGPCLKERFAALAEKHSVDMVPEPTKGTLRRWIAWKQDCFDSLKRFRVCDPACGSGAFLIQAYEYLEDAYEDIIADLVAHKAANEDKLRETVSETILRENLFGVDLSPEAVELTQLALWIRTARKNCTLTDLSRNILCGNSLVDDSDVDHRAFDWAGKFARVFEEGKFDCVISNPPYVKLQNFRKREPKIAEYLVERYRSARTGNFDMYLPFIERGLDLLKPDGRMGFIAPNVWLFNEYGEGLRELVVERRALDRFVDFKSFQVFADATTYTALQFFRGSPSERIEVADAGAGELKDLSFYDVSYGGLGPGAWALLGSREQEILDTMRARSVTLEEATSQIFQGLITSADAVYHLIRLGSGRFYSKALDREVEIEDEIMKPLISGEDAVPFATPPTDKYLLFPYLVTADECRLFTEKEMSRRKRAWAYLLQNEAALRARESGKFDDDQWWRFGRHQNIDKQILPKLLVPRLLFNLFASADPHGEVCIDNVDVGGIVINHDWTLYYLLAILNSRACSFAWRLTSKPFRGEYRSANKQFIAPLPIPKTKAQKPIADLARKLADLHAKVLTLTRAVHRRFQTDLPSPMLLPTSPLPPSLPEKLRVFDELPLGQALALMEKFAKRRMKPSEREDWDHYLSKQCATLGKLRREIRDLEGELNERAYKLYGLSKNYIERIEG